MAYWLMKSEPAVYSIGDLAQEQQAIWDGVRNYQARNFLRQMQVGDVAFFYHSNTKPPGIAGLMRIIAAQVVDPTQFETDSKYYDPKSTPEAPRWQTVTVEFMEAFETLIPLERLKQAFQPEELALVRKGNRLSVMPVEERVADRILALRN
jgi:predicted RNA-binding protein with PUA-like domain